MTDATTGTAPPPHCTAGVTWERRPDDVPMEPTESRPFHLRYRSRCRGCGHVGPARAVENEAAEDACDHAYPGWRTMPVLEHRPYDNRKKEARWEEAARAVYPSGWFEQQGPVRTYRHNGGMRHVPGRGPNHGYDMAVAAPAQTRPSAAEQQSLFG